MAAGLNVGMRLNLSLRLEVCEVEAGANDGMRMIAVLKGDKIETERLLLQKPCQLAGGGNCQLRSYKQLPHLGGTLSAERRTPSHLYR